MKKLLLLSAFSASILFSGIAIAQDDSNNVPKLVNKPLHKPYIPDVPPTAKSNASDNSVVPKAKDGQVEVVRTDSKNSNEVTSSYSTNQNTNYHKVEQNTTSDQGQNEYSDQSTTDNTSPVQNNTTITTLDTGSKYYIQVGAFGDVNNAVKTSKSLRSEGLHIAIVPITLRSGKVLYRVRIYNLMEKATSDMILENIHGKGFVTARVYKNRNKHNTKILPE